MELKHEVRLAASKMIVTAAVLAASNPPRLGLFRTRALQVNARLLCPWRRRRERHHSYSRAFSTQQHDSVSVEVGSRCVLLDGIVDTLLF